MDIQNLFQKSAQEDKPSKSTKVVCVGNELDDRPLIFRLGDEYKLTHSSSEKRFDFIKNGSVDIGFISSIDYARLKGGWKIFPGICKSSYNDSKRVILFFNKSMSKLKNIAVSPTCRTSKTATDILMRERYQLACSYKETTGDLTSLLKKFDAVLLSGDNAFESAAIIKSNLDISEEWRDMTGLPLVHGFWVGNEIQVSKDDVINFSNSLKIGLENSKHIAEEAILKVSFESKSGYLSAGINYDFNEDVQASLEELFRYAFFYGLTKYIPDLNYLE